MNRRFVLPTLAVICGLAFAGCNTEPNKTINADREDFSKAGGLLKPQAVGDNLGVGGNTWASLNPGAGGQIQGVVLDPNTLNKAFLLSDVDGLYRSTDGGGNWTYASDGLAGTDTLALAVKPGNSNLVFLGTSAGFHTSVNGGSNWTLHPQINRLATGTNGFAQLTNVSPNLTGDGDKGPGFGGPYKMSTGSVVVNPKSGVTNQVVVGLGSRRWSWVDQATVFRSTNDGSTFARVQFGPTTGGNRSVLQLATRQTSGNTELYAAVGDGGLWRSTNFGAAGTWTQIAKPSAASNRAEGVALTADGQTLYAVYGNGQDVNVASAVSEIYAIRTSGIGNPANWKKVTFNGLASEAQSYFRTISLDPEATGTTQRFLTSAGGSNQRFGLLEVTVTWNSTFTSLTSTWNKIFQFGQRFDPNNPSNQPDYVNGWSTGLGWEGGIFGNRPQPRSFTYAPIGWTNKQVWTTGDQTIFKNTVNRSNTYYKQSWTNLYSVPVTQYPQLTDFTAEGDKVVNVGWTPVNTFNSILDANGLPTSLLRLPSLGPITTHRSNGTAFTVDTDADLYGNIVISSKGDHGLTTSYDGGLTWENVSQPRRAKSQSNLLVKVPNQNKLIAVAHFTDPFDFGATGGAGNANGELWGREIDLSNPGPGGWYFLAGGKQGVGSYESDGVAPNGDQRLGLVNDFYTNILSDPSNPLKVYITTKNSGIFRIDNIEFLLCVRRNVPACGTALPTFTQITGSNVRANEYEGSAVIDPNNTNFMYVADNQYLKRVNLTNGNVETLRQNSSADYLVNIDVWNVGGTTWVAASQDFNDIWISKVGTNNSLNWTRPFNRFDLINARPNSRFDNSAVTTSRLILHAVEGDGNKIYATVQVQDPENIGYGIFEVSFDTATGARTGITDITGAHRFPKSFRTEVVANQADGTKHLLMSSWGAGLWKVKINLATQ
jgi:hypothetical protein